jgi:hypothetical protein
MSAKRTRTRVAATKSRQSPSNKKRSHQRKEQRADSGTMEIAHRIPKRLTATAAKGEYERLASYYASMTTTGMPRYKSVDLVPEDRT